MTSTRTALFPVFVDPPSETTSSRRQQANSSSACSFTSRPILSCKPITSSTTTSSLSSAYSSLSLNSSTSKPSLSNSAASASSKSSSSSKSKPPSPRKSLAIFCDDNQQETLKENIPLQKQQQPSVGGDKKRKGLKELGVSSSNNSNARPAGAVSKKRREVMRDVSAEYEDCRVTDEPEGFRTVCPKSSVTPFEIFVDPTPAAPACHRITSSAIPRAGTALSSKLNQIPPVSFLGAPFAATNTTKKPIKKAFSVYTSPQKLPSAEDIAVVKPKPKVSRGLGLGGPGYAAKGLRG